METSSNANPAMQWDKLRAWITVELAPTLSLDRDWHYLPRSVAGHKPIPDSLAPQQDLYVQTGLKCKGHFA